MDGHVFISHSTKDLKVANRIYDDLSRRGISCWMGTRDIAPGMDYQSSIVRAIRAAKALLIVFTKNANDSTDVSKEVALANKYRVLIIPGRLEDVEPSDALEYELTTRQWHNLFGDWDTAMDGLAGRIGPERSPDKIVERQPTTTITPSEPVGKAPPGRGLFRFLLHPEPAHLRVAGLALVAEVTALVPTLLLAMSDSEATWTTEKTTAAVVYGGLFLMAGVTGVFVEQNRRRVRPFGIVVCIICFLLCSIFSYVVPRNHPAEVLFVVVSFIGSVLFLLSTIILLRWKSKS